MVGVNSEALSALHSAIAARDVKAVRRVLKTGVDVNDLHHAHGWPLSHAVEVGDKAIVKALLGAGADPNKEDLVRRCIEEDKPAIAKVLIGHGVNLNGQPTWEKDDDFETSLIYAVREGRRSIAKDLLEAGADPNRHDGNNESALLVAKMRKDRALVKLLEPRVSDAERAWVEERFGPAWEARVALDRKIEEAILLGDRERLLGLLRDSGRPLDDWLRPEGLYPLELALAHFYDVRYGRPPVRGKPHNPNVTLDEVAEVIEALIDLGAPLDKGVYFPPIGKCVNLGADYRRLFLKAVELCPNIDASTTMDGFTALRSAAATRAVEELKILLAHGADPNAKDRHGRSVLHAARIQEEFRGPNPCVPLLIAAGAKEE